MAKINLLSWRDEQRQEKKKEFFTVLVGFGVLGLICGFLWVTSVKDAIAGQNSRNLLLQTEIDILQEEVAEIQELKKRRAELVDRMRVIQNLQGLRPVIVRYFDSLVRAVPDGVHLTLLTRGGNQIDIEGIAESPNRISAFMRNLDESEWFESANVSTIRLAPEAGEQAQQFRMSIATVVPDVDAVEGEGN